MQPYLARLGSRQTRNSSQRQVMISARSTMPALLYKRIVCRRAATNAESRSVPSETRKPRTRSLARAESSSEPPGACAREEDTLAFEAPGGGPCAKGILVRPTMEGAESQHLCGRETRRKLHGAPSPVEPTRRRHELALYDLPPLARNHKVSRALELLGRPPRLQLVLPSALPLLGPAEVAEAASGSVLATPGVHECAWPATAIEVAHGADAGKLRGARRGPRRRRRRPCCGGKLAERLRQTQHGLPCRCVAKPSIKRRRIRHGR